MPEGGNKTERNPGWEYGLQWYQTQSNGESNELHSTKPSQMVSCCLSTQVAKKVSQMDRIDQMESNGLQSTKPIQIVKWCLVA